MTIKRKQFSTNVSIPLLGKLKDLSNQTGSKTSRLVDEALEGLLDKYGEKGGNSIMKDTSDKRTQHIICVTNNKGGVGKTTTTAALAYLFAKKGGKQVLVIDADAQMNLSMIMQAKVNGKQNIRNLLYNCINADFKYPVEQFILPSGFKGIDIIVGDSIINKEEMMSIIRSARMDIGINPWVEIMNRIVDIQKYDVIFMDTHPSTSTETMLPMQACNEVLVPVEPAESSVVGIFQVYSNICKTRRAKPDLRYLGAFFNKIKLNTSSTNEYIPSARNMIAARIKEMNHGKEDGVVFKTMIRQSEDARKADILHCPVTERFANKKIARDFTKLYEEVLKLYE